MQTECPHCHTVFRLSDRDLEHAEGQVRCGHCLAIFSAANPFQSHHEIELNAAPEDPVVLDELESFRSEDTGKPVLPDVIPPELRAESRDKKRSYGIAGNLLWSFAILLAIAAGLLQYAYYDRLRLLKHEELRPWLGLMCKYTHCNLPDPRDPQRIELSSKNIYTHPNAENALMVSGTMINQAGFAQNFPLLELRFENIRGELIAGRRFQPHEYLGLPAERIEKMQPGNPVSFNIEIVDPGKDVMSYEFKFL